MKNRIWIIWAAVAVIILQTLAIVKIFRENNRLSDNFKAVVTGMEYYRSTDSIAAARNERLLLETSEIKRFFPSVATSIEQLNVKMRQLERYSAVNMAAGYDLANHLRDTVIIREGIVRDTLKMQYVKYQNEWIDFQQAIVADSAYTSIRTRDSITIVQSWERPHKFWFLKWGRKRHMQTVTNANPHSRITYSTYIEKK